MIKSLGRLDELSKVYPDPIAHFKEEAQKKTLESRKARTLLVPIDTEEKMSTEEDNLKNVGYGILKYLYKELELDTFWNRRSKGRSFQYSPDQICRLLTFGRTLYPASKKGTYDARDIFYEKFDDFSLDYYPSAVNPTTGLSPREQMEINYEYCVEYARHFRPGPDRNLLFNGASGLGKTFLSACIAREVVEHGYSVVYDTAIHLFSCLEKQKFGGATEEELRMADRIPECDLLILDDLGTEMATAFIPPCPVFHHQQPYPVRKAHHHLHKLHDRSVISALYTSDSFPAGR